MTLKNYHVNNKLNFKCSLRRDYFLKLSKEKKYFEMIKLTIFIISEKKYTSTKLILNN